MAELAPRDRLQPSLLDRLTDMEPDKTTEPRERRVLSVRTLRQSVLRDLALLLNTHRMFDSYFDAKPYPEVSRSVVNYGMQDVSGVTISGLELPEMALGIKNAILSFEPRLIPASVTVKPISDLQKANHYNKISFEIQADMWALPFPEHLYLKTELDIEVGAFRVSELEARR